jgi:uncharacterized membrane protein|tara:strand:- start:349 stop:537 length:189 start_codon:yes stop_codon:yes gene_type:complete
MAGVPQRVSPRPVVLIIRKFFTEFLAIFVQYLLINVVINVVAVYLRHQLARKITPQRRLSSK